MIVIGALIVVPLIAALLVLVIRGEVFRTAVVIITAALLCVLALVLTVQHLFAPASFSVPSAHALNYVMLGVELVCSLYIIYRAFRASNALVAFIAVVQIILVIIYETVFAHSAEVSADLYVDQLSLIMALIIAVIGGLISVYSLGYMRDYQKHLEEQRVSAVSSGEPGLKAESQELLRDRRHIFFSVILIFLSAMFLVVFANRLSWLLTAWEVTTLSSFVLIGYSRTEEATRNSFKAVTINLVGGLAFLVALIVLAGNQYGIFALDSLMVSAVGGSLVLPLILIAFAGMTKAAQMPFQGWLLGAMVAPTPVSALLHSSTMVKAGVFVLIKLSPALGWTIPGAFVVAVGGLSFLICAALAISQNNAKRVLAYSTVSNLGLIICCAGIGTPEAAWAAIFLLIFHAAAKALLFCCVGTAEHRLGTRDIERMDNIFVRLPWIATFMALGMMAMFIAPFGMLVSKWAALVSIAESGHVEMLFILAFGSALTFVFWAKWLGKVLSIGPSEPVAREKTSIMERCSLSLMAALLILVTLLMPVISDSVVVPYLREKGRELLLMPWALASDVIGHENLVFMSIVFVVILGLFALQFLRRHRKSYDTVYLAGISQDSDKRTFTNAFEGTDVSLQRNWYMKELFGEKAILRPALLLMAAVMSIFLLIGLVAELMVL